MVFSSHHYVIKQSQQRSLQFGVTSTISESDYLESHMLRLIKEKDEQMVRSILPTIEKFIPMVFAHHSILVLSNRDGYILHSQGDPHFLDHASKIQLLEGAGWREEVRGTNAIGTAIVEKSPVYVVGDEHYCKMNHTLYCAASPIFDPSGEILAVLDVSGYAGDFHQSIPFVIDGIARQMEDWLLLGHEKSQLVLEVTDRQQRYLFAFDQAGQLSGTNREARKFLSTIWSDPELACETTLRKLFPRHQYEMSVLLDRRTPFVSMTGNRRPTFPTNREIFCQDPNLEKALQLASRAALTDMNVLIDGESGTGKELVAKFIHQHSERRDGPLIAINCGAISPHLLHSELFGYEGKAFTGASANGQAGKFEAANGGTIFLDEIADMPEDMQVALLRVLQEKMVTRIGGHRMIPVNVRVIAATNRDLWEEVKKERFRLDLYFRLMGVQISLPPLRERMDKLALGEFLLEGIAHEMNVPLPVLSASTIDVLNAYHFPGNVRELYAVLRQSVFLADQGIIHPVHLPPHMTTLSTSQTMDTCHHSLRVDHQANDCKKALVDFYQWATENQHRFYGKAKDRQMEDCIGRWDGKDEWEFIAVQQTNLKEFLSISGYSPMKILTEWRNNGWIETAGGRKGFTKFVKIGGGSGTSLVVIARNALEKVVNASKSVNG